MTSSEATSSRPAGTTAPRDLPRDGLVAVVKEDCPTCQLVAPVLRRMQESGLLSAIVTQDEPDFPPGAHAIGRLVQ